MKDVTVTSFGLVIAYLLPGLSLLYTLGFWFPEIHSLFQAFLTTTSNLGLFLIVVLVSLIVGLIIHGIRAVVYEYIFCKKANRFEHAQFKKFTSTGRADAFATLLTRCPISPMVGRSIDHLALLRLRFLAEGEQDSRLERLRSGSQ